MANGGGGTQQQVEINPTETPTETVTETARLEAKPTDTPTPEGKPSETPTPEPKATETPDPGIIDSIVISQPTEEPRLVIQSKAGEVIDLGDEGIAQIDTSGATLQALDGMLTVVMNNSALSEGLKVKVNHKKDLRSSLSGNTFEITAESLKSGKEVNKFKGMIELQIKYDAETYEGKEDALSMYYFDDASDEWIALVSTVDKENHILKAWTNHLTVFDWDANYFTPNYIPSINNTGVSAYTGAATYSFPIWVPAGPGGFQPQLALTYNSQAVDEMGLYSQGSWAGTGWNIDVPHIVLVKDKMYGSSRGAPYLLYINGPVTRCYSAWMGNTIPSRRKPF